MFAIQRPLPRTQIKDGPTIEFQYQDWRPVEASELPFTIQIDDGSRQFTYRFSDVRYDANSFSSYTLSK